MIAVAHDDMSDVRTASVTVAICTINRLALLRENIDVTLAQMQEFPNARLLVIDNGSSDGTVEYLQALAAGNSRVAVLHEARMGVYYARTTAIAAAVGDYIVFLDDDVLPDAGWLLGILKPLVRESKIGVTGCVARPRWLAPRPDWFPERFIDEFAAIHKVDRRVYCKFPGYPPALGLALRRHPCLGLYAHPARTKIALGHRSNDDSKPIYSGEDSDLCELYARNGFDIIIDDSPGVSHAVHAARLTQEWFFRRFRSEGHNRIYLCRLFGRPMLSASNCKMFLAWPALAVLRLFTPLMSAQQRMLVLSYYEKSAGAVREAVGGPRETPFPFHIDEAGNARP
jgi:glycosyltransferase involved in cell wall biosynthesis